MENYIHNIHFVNFNDDNIIISIECFIPFAPSTFYCVYYGDDVYMGLMVGESSLHLHPLYRLGINSEE